MRNYSRFIAVTAVASAALLLFPLVSAQAHLDVGFGEITVEQPLAAPAIPFNPLSTDLSAGSAAPWGGWAGDIAVVEPREIPADHVVFYGEDGPYGDAWVEDLEGGPATGVFYAADGAFGDVACLESCDGGLKELVAGTVAAEVLAAPAANAGPGVVAGSLTTPAAVSWLWTP